MDTRLKVFSIGNPEEEITRPYEGQSGYRQRLTRQGEEIGRELVFYKEGQGWLTRQEELELMKE